MYNRSSRNKSKRTKRVMDITISGLAVVLFLPVWIMAILLIFFGDPGQVFFRQSRIGKDEKPFDLLKFRTMFHAPPAGKASSVTLINDPRIFRGGCFLRKYKIDELPQLINVLEGSMSLVGPRPTVYEDFEKMNQEQRRRFEVRPGLTGLAQISGNTALPWQKRIRYDLEYIERQSVWLDLKILFQTAFLVLTGKAETHPPGDDEWEDR